MNPTEVLVLFSIFAMIALYFLWKATSKMIFDEKINIIQDLIKSCKGSQINEANFELIDGMINDLTVHNDYQHWRKAKIWTDFVRKFEKVNKYKV